MKTKKAHKQDWASALVTKQLPTTTSIQQAYISIARV